MEIRKATINDLPFLVEFTAKEAREAEGITKPTETLESGIIRALEDESKAVYWVMIDDHAIPVASVSAVKEWSDWNAGYYWWIQSMYVSPDHRGKGLHVELIKVVELEMRRQGGLELRLYVHKDNIRAKKAYGKAGFTNTDYEIMSLSPSRRE